MYFRFTVVAESEFEFSKISDEPVRVVQKMEDPGGNVYISFWQYIGQIITDHVICQCPG